MNPLHQSLFFSFTYRDLSSSTFGSCFSCFHSKLTFTNIPKKGRRSEPNQSTHLVKDFLLHEDPLLTPRANEWHHQNLSNLIFWGSYLRSPSTIEHDFSSEYLFFPPKLFFKPHLKHCLYDDFLGHSSQKWFPLIYLKFLLFVYLLSYNEETARVPTQKFS